MLKKLTRKALSFFMVVMLMMAMLTSTAEAAKPGGGGSTNKPPVISLASSIPTLTEDTSAAAKITLSATDPEGNRFTWSITSVTLGTATLSGTINPTGTGTIIVNFTASSNANGTAVVTVQAKDKLGAASTLPVSITIQPVNDPPAFTTLPSISGTVATGQTITANKGAWSDVETSASSLAFSYQWQKSSSANGANPVKIADATSNAYTITSSDTGYISVAVTATDTGDHGTPPLSTTASSPWVQITQQQVQQPQYYVALGDSIAAGTNNQNLLGNSYRYTNTFSNSLAAIYSSTSYGYKNDAFPGDTTDDLLSKLQTDSTIRTDVSKATIITISIGGNNVLSSASPEGYSKINDAQATAGVDNFESDLPDIVAQINALHVAGHLPQIYIMDMYNLFHPWERGWVVYSDTRGEVSVFMHQAIEPYLGRMKAAIDTTASLNANVYHVNTYDAFENQSNRFVITNSSYIKYDLTFASVSNPDGSYFYSPYIEKTAVYSDSLTRFDIYPFYPILFDYANLDHYRDPHPDQLGHDVLSAAHLAKFKAVNRLP